jgi:hypothetical protein
MPDRDPVEAPLSEEQRARLRESREDLGRLLRSARLATLTIWTLGIFGCLTLAWGLLGGGGILLGLVLLAVAWNERRGRDLLRVLEPEGARVLGWNQLILALVVTGYCLLVIWRAGAGPDPALREVEELLGISPDLVADLTRTVYGAVIVVVWPVQALLARYHFGRKDRMEEFRRATPPWIQDLLRE